VYDPNSRSDVATVLLTVLSVELVCISIPKGRETNTMAQTKG
jgi:hypothetical protein